MRNARNLCYPCLGCDELAFFQKHPLIFGRTKYVHLPASARLLNSTTHNGLGSVEVGALSAQKSSRSAGTRRGLQLVGSVREPIYMDISHDAVVRREAGRLTGQHCF
jgi:hypothetical protein